MTSLPSTPTAHTPGPWEITPIYESDLAGIALHIAIPEAYLFPITSRHTPVERKANTSLIEAAPQLLEACREADLLLTDIYNALTDVDPEERERYKRVFAVLDAATAKAEGRA